MEIHVIQPNTRKFTWKFETLSTWFLHGIPREHFYVEFHVELHVEDLKFWCRFKRGWMNSRENPIIFLNEIPSNFVKFQNIPLNLIELCWISLYSFEFPCIPLHLIKFLLNSIVFHCSLSDSVEIHAIPFNLIELCCILLYSVEYYWIMLNSIVPCGILSNSVEFHCAPLNSVKFG